MPMHDPENVPVARQHGTPQRTKKPLWKVSILYMLWLLWVVFWSFLSVDWQRTRHLFFKSALQEGYKIVDCSLIKEQEVLQTSAVFMFSSGLVANFLSGSPWDVTNIRAISQWVNSTDYQNYVQQNNITRHTPQLVWDHGIKAATAFRILWGTCMLLTLFAVICSYIARTALFMCWNLHSQNLETVRDLAKQQADRWARSKGLSHASDEDRKAKAQEAVDAMVQDKKPQMKGVMRYISVVISTGKVCYMTSLILWLITIIHAIVELRTLVELDRHNNNNQSSTIGAAILLTIAGFASIVAVTAFALLFTCCWTTYATWKPSMQPQSFVNHCYQVGVTKALAEPATVLRHINDKAHNKFNHRVLQLSDMPDPPHADSQSCGTDAGQPLAPVGKDGSGGPTQHYGGPTTPSPLGPDGQRSWMNNNVDNNSSPGIRDNSPCTNQPPIA